MNRQISPQGLPKAHVLPEVDETGWEILEVGESV